MKRDLQNLSGTYMDLEPYAYGEALGQRTFTFENGKWTLEFTLGLDLKLLWLLSQTPGKGLNVYNPV